MHAIKGKVTILDSPVKGESTILVPSDSEGTPGRPPKECKQDSESENSHECMNTTYSDNSNTDSDLGKGKRENVSPTKLTPEVCSYRCHTCPVVIKKKSESAVAALKKKFEANPAMKPQRAVNALISEAIKHGQAWDEIEYLTDTLLNSSLPKNVKQKVCKELHPDEHSFEAVQILKNLLDKKTRFIYSK
ncbi:Hypothetical predicted protein [Paramuricea clavata]|uniref:Uncharacterized protein n=1 Tax=Paramuricea clavata TaxID=317549 RepID=A0A6S7IXZ2_PARCT|nr:Hypothetical predicted protein [Paramuricea clavata]